MRRLRQEHGEGYQDDVLKAADRYDVAWVAFWDPDETVFRLLEQAGYRRTATLSTPHFGREVINVFRYDRFQQDDPVTIYSNGMTLQRAEIVDGGRRVDLWWTADEPLPDDYTVSVFLLDEAGQLAVQHDSYPLENERPTTGWEPGEIIYDPHPIELSGLPPGRYTAGVKVYTWYDGQVRKTVDGEPWTTVGNIELG